MSLALKGRIGIKGMEGKNHTEEAKRKMSKLHIGKCIGNKHALGNKSRTGMKHSEETKRKISETKRLKCLP